MSVTSGAALYELSPAWDARTVTLPAPAMWTALPERVAGPEAILKLTGRPEEAVALTVKSLLPKMLSEAAEVDRLAGLVHDLYQLRRCAWR